jgi:molybdopterin-guanine dinucleotide biosynthesis protein A
MTGAILFGGKSSRMGQPKHEVRLSDGTTFLERVQAAIRPLCSQIALLGDHEYSASDEFIIIKDLRPGLGPMAGLESLLKSNLDSHYLIVACDMPLLTPDICRLLIHDSASVSIFESTEIGKYLPFPGIYRTELAPLVSRSLDEDRRSLQQLFRSLPDIHVLPLTPELEQSVRSFNTPESIHELEAILQSQS